MGADLYVTKPFSTRDLMSRIEGLLEPPSRATRADVELTSIALRRATMLHCNIATRRSV